MFGDVKEESNWLELKGLVISLVVINWVWTWRICVIVFEFGRRERSWSFDITGFFMVRTEKAGQFHLEYFDNMYCFFCLFSLRVKGLSRAFAFSTSRFVFGFFFYFFDCQSVRDIIT